MWYNNSDIEKVLQVKRLTPTTVTHGAPSHESLPSLVARPEEWEKNGFQYVLEETLYYLK